MKKEDNNNLWKYAGLSTQFLVGIGLFLFLGYQLDHYMHFKIPLTIWLFPLLFILGVIVKLIIETSKKNNS